MCRGAIVTHNGKLMWPPPPPPTPPPTPSKKEAKVEVKPVDFEAEARSRAMLMTGAAATVYGVGIGSPEAHAQQMFTTFSLACIGGCCPPPLVLIGHAARASAGAAPRPAPLPGEVTRLRIAGAPCGIASVPFGAQEGSLKP